MKTLIKFYADWCGPCKPMEKVAADVAEKYGFELKSVNIDDEAAYAEAFLVRSIPHLVLIDEEQNIWGRHVGSAPASAVEKSLGLST